MTILEVKDLGEGKLQVTYPEDQQKKDDIERWLKNVSPGYVEYLLNSNGQDPHCNSCRDFGCENQGMGDDACRGFKFGEAW